MKKLKTRLISFLLMFAMLATMVPSVAFAADVTSSEIYEQLKEYYDGDASTAKAAVEKLQDAGFLDESGNAVPIDIRYDGKSITFDELNEKIEKGEATGTITFNGKIVSSEQVAELMRLYEMLDFLLSLKKDVPITDETVANLESLAKAIASGEVDFGKELTGVKTVKGVKNVPMQTMSLGTPKPSVLAAGADPLWPDTTSDFGDLTFSYQSGKKGYQEHYIGKQDSDGGAGYTEEYHFDLINQNAKQWYADDLYDGSGINHETAIQFRLSEPEKYFSHEYYNYNSTITLYTGFASKKALPVPVSFKLRVVDGSYNLANINGEKEITLTWEPGETDNKVIEITLPDMAESDPWTGDRVFYLQAYDFQNAACGNLDVWEQEINVYSEKDLVLKVEGQAYQNISSETTAMSRDSDVLKLSYTTQANVVANSALPQMLDRDYHINAKLSVALYGDTSKPTKDHNFYYLPNEDHTDGPKVGIKGNFNDASRYSARFNMDWTVGNIGRNWYQQVTDSNIFRSGNESTYTDEIDTIVKGSEQSGKPVKVADNLNSARLGVISYNDPADTAFGNDSSYVYAAYPRRDITMSYSFQAVHPETKIESVNIPDGRFYYGQNIPITVEFDDFMTVSDAMTLTVNGTELKPVPAQLGMISETCTFLYPVKKIDTGTVKLQKLEFANNDIVEKASGVLTGSGLNTCLTNSDFNGIDEADLENTDCKIISDNKLGSILTANDEQYSHRAFAVTYGIDDEPPTMQNVVIQYDINQSDKAYYEWLGDKEIVDISATPVNVIDKNGETFEALDYLYGAYISCDGGMTRYPVYVKRTTDGNQQPTALVANVTPQVNPTADIRKDTYELYFETEPITSDDVKYLPDFDKAVKDAIGNYFFVCGERDENVTDKLVFTKTDGISDARIAMGANYTLQVKGGIFLEEDYGDVTIVGNDTWNSIHNACAIETGIPALKLGYTINDRQPDAEPYYTKNMFTFRADEWFTWESSDESIATIEKDGSINLTGKPGTCYFTLTIHNGDIEQFIYTLDSETLTVKEGLSPYLLIPASSAERTTLQNAETAIYFTSNLTARNAAEGKASTDFNITVYKSADVNEFDEPADGAKPVYTGKVTNTLNESVSRLLIPENVLADSGANAYTAIISAEHYDGSAYSASAHISVKMQPIKAKLNQLDSYYVLSDSIPALGYTVENAVEGAEIYYTVQSSGKALQKFTLSELTGTLGTEAFTKPEEMKEVYSVTLFAKNPDDVAYSVDSMLLTVYNKEAIELVLADVTRGEIGGTTGGVGDKSSSVLMDNTSFIEQMVDNHTIKLGDGGVISFDDLRFDTNLQKLISVNYGEGTYGMLSDRIAWASANSGIASVDFKQGGLYSNVEAYTYTSYAPVNDLLIVGHKGGKTTVTAEHINTGTKRSVDVTVNTLKDKLYVFQFLPKQTTTAQYYTTVNGKQEFVTVESNEQGQLAVYEPNGIQSDVWLKSGDTKNGVYLATIFNEDLYTAEKDITAMRVYPCNDRALQLASEATLYFRNPDGSAYANNTVTLRGGVYKNDLYCPDAKFYTNAESDFTDAKEGRADFTAKTDANGKVIIKMDPELFYVKSNDETLYGSDMLDFVFEYRFSEEGYLPGYVTCTVNPDQFSDTKDGVINIKSVSGDTPVVISQFIQQYYLQNGNYAATNYIMDVSNSRDNVGTSNEFEKVRLENIVALRGETTDMTGANGYAAYDNADKYRVDIVDENGVVPNGQNISDKAATVITDLKALTDEKTAAFVFPFSAVPMLRNVYVMDRTNFGKIGNTKHKAADGSDVYNYSYLPYGENVHAKVATLKDGATVTSEQLPFAISNYADKSNPLTDGTTEQVGETAQKKVSEELDIGAIFDNIDVNDMLKNGFKFFMSLGKEAADLPVDLQIFPTEDPAVFRVLVSIGVEEDVGDDEEEDEEEEDDDDDEDENALDLGYNIEVSPKQALKSIEELAKDDDDEDEDEESKGSFSFNYHGAVEAEVSLGDGKWNVEFVGGSVGAGAKAGYSYSMQFSVGPVPALISFKAGAGADLTVFFAKGMDNVPDLMIKALLEASLEAFAGVGVDNTLFELTLGIFGEIGAEVEALFLTKAFESLDTGMHLGIDGEIGLRFTARVLCVSYSNVFASTSFGWEKDFWDYQQINDYWDGKGLHLMGLTSNGDPVSVMITPDGNALVQISQNKIESRNYLTNFTRTGLGSGPMMLLSATPSVPGKPSDIQTNAYPYAQPNVTDDGAILLYFSDEDSADEVKSVLHYALHDGNDYIEYGAVDSSLIPKSFMDNSVDVSGTDGNYFAAWSGQTEEVKKEAGAIVTGDDLALMMNSVEIFGGVYNANTESWDVTQLTDNYSGDLAPTVASSGNKAIAAWRNADSSNLKTGDGENLLGSFNVNDTINYRYYNGSVWKTAKVAYNGSNGNTSSVSSAMLPDGTALLAYSVMTDADDDTSGEIFYTLINNDGEVVNTVRVTNDSVRDLKVVAETVDGQFILSWYCEHSDSKEATVVGGESVNTVLRDLCFAAVDSKGAVNVDFIEGLGHEVADDFALVGKQGGKLSDLAILWTEKSGDNYEIKAAKFCDTGNGKTVLSTPYAVAKTSDFVTVENFDAYQDADGIHTVMIGADYSAGKASEVGKVNLNSLKDMNGQTPSGLPNADSLAILEAEPEYKIMKATSTLPTEALTATVKQPDVTKLMRGLTLPISVKVQNTGTTTLNTITVNIGGQTKTFENVGLLPGAETTLMVGYEVPQTITDVTCRVNSGVASDTDTLMLNLPDVGISSVKLISEADNQRTVEVALENGTDIPLKSSGKTVKLAFYKDRNYKNMIGSPIEIPDAEYANIDNGVYTLRHTLNVSDLVGTANIEIPESGVKLYIKTWVEDVEEPYALNNTDMITLRSLKAKNGGETFTMNADVLSDGNGYTVSAFMRNNSVQANTTGQIDALLFNSSGTVVGQTTVVTAGNDSFTGEQSKTFTASVSNVEETPVTAQLINVKETGATVIFDATDGICGLDSMKVGEDDTLSYLPTATRDGYTFQGWFTAAEGGDAVNKGTIFTADTTVYAHWQKKSSGGGSGSGGSGTTGTSSTVKTAASVKNGSVSVSQKSPKKGETVTINATPDKGYEIDKLTVKDSKGNIVDITDSGDGQYTFIMPDSTVSIDVTFKEISSGQETDGEIKDITSDFDSAFSDIKESDWFYNQVKYVYDNKFMQGISDSEFAPNMPVTRAMFATVLHRMDGEPEVTTDNVFTDVMSGEYYEKAVAWAQENGLVYGVSETEYAPNTNITREQMATIIYRYAIFKGIDTESVMENTNTLSHNDIFKVSDWAKEAMNYCIAAGIITGDNNGNLNPQNNATRAEFATILMRVADIIK